MSTYDLGDIVALAWPLGTSATVSATVTLPDATTASAAVTGSSVYTASYTTTQAGRHVIRFVATGSTQGAHVDTFNVLPADPGFIIGLADARDALNLTAANTAHDDELRSYLAAATPVIEDITGPVLKATKTYTTDGGHVAVMLPHTDVTVTAVAEGSTTLAASQYAVDSAAGVVRRSAGTGYLPFLEGVRNVTVTYTVGSGVVAPNVAMATRELVRHWYQQGQQANRPSFGGSDVEAVFTPSGYAVPRRVIELLGTPAMRPGMA